MTTQKKMILPIIILLVALVGVFWISTEKVHGLSVPSSTGIVNDEEGVNIRGSYSTDAAVVGNAPYQGGVLITKERFTSSSSTAKTTRWYYVEGGYGNGWIRSDLLDVSYASMEGKINSTVNIRKGAGTSFEAVTSLNEGDTVDVKMVVYSSNGYKWYKIYYNKYYRYVRATYVDLQEPVVEEGTAQPTVNTNFDQELALFPSSYHEALKALHEKYPTWHFKANVVDYTWNDALAKMTSNYGTNTIPSSKPDAYKAVAKETYDFDAKSYIPFDGSTWLAASKKAVAYYMDPRNWLDEISVFMFESLSFDPVTQQEAMVKQILSATAIPQKYSSSYMAAGAEYNISPIYLANKSRLELGSSSFMVDGHQFTYGGKTYKGYYNAYNIGASDGGNAALKGLYYAASGSTYLRPWNTLDKAIRGGAKFIAEDFVGNNQHTAYYEHFNVANGLDAVGTHPYMTNTMAAATHANLTYWDYRDNGMLDTAFTFEIPVFQGMPSSAANAPGSGNNNCFLDTLKVYNGDTRLYYTMNFDRFTSTHTLKKSVGAEVNELTVKATTNASDATVTITGNTDLKIGENKITVKVKSSSGLVKTYYIKVNKLPTSTVVGAPSLTMSSDATTGKPVLTWAAGVNADEYKIYRSTSKTGTFKLLATLTNTTTSYVDAKAKAGTKYYYKVKSVGTTDVIGEAESTIKYRTCDLSQPIVTPGNRPSDGKPQLTWSDVPGAEKYKIYRAETPDGEYVLKCTQKSTTYTNTKDVAVGTTYYYKVKAIHENTEANSAYSAVITGVCALAKPVVTTGNHEESGKPQLSWEPVDGAEKYEVYRADAGSDSFVKMKTVTMCPYTNTTAHAGQTYQYMVKAIHSNPMANSADSDIVTVKCLYEKLLVEAGNNGVDGKPQLTWNEIPGAEKYEVYRSTSETGVYTKMKTVRTNTYINKTAKTGNPYYYMVKVYGDVSEDGNPVTSEIVFSTCKLAQPEVKLSNRASDGKIKLTWSAIEGADKYIIYSASSRNGKYTKLYTKKSTSHVHAKSVAGQKYYYKVMAVYLENEDANSVLSEVKYRVCDLARPEIEISRRSSDGKTKLTWKKVDGADQYVVYYSTSRTGTYKKLATKTGTVHTHVKGKTGTTYYYKVKAVSTANSNANSAYSKLKYTKSR